MQECTMQKSLTHAFFVASTFGTSLGLSGCASFNTNVNPDSCIQQSSGFVGIPFIMEIGGKGSATFNKNCEKGRNLAAVPMLGQSQDGNLAPASIIIFYKQYFEELMGKINKLSSDEVIPDLEIKNFTDHFLKSLSNGRLNANMLKTMYDEKITNLNLVNPDGTLKLVEKSVTTRSSGPSSKFTCKPNGEIFLTCFPNATP